MDGGLALYAHPDRCTYVVAAHEMPFAYFLQGDFRDFICFGEGVIIHGKGREYEPLAVGAADYFRHYF